MSTHKMSAASTCTEALADIARSEKAIEALAVIHDSCTKTSESLIANQQLGLGYPCKIGDYDECNAATPILHASGIKSVQAVTFCVLGLIAKNGMPRPEGGAMGGVCLPSVCQEQSLTSPEFIGYLDHTLESDLALTSLGRKYLLNIRDTVELSKHTDASFTCGAHKVAFDSGSMTVVGILVVLLTLLVVATVSEYWAPSIYRRMGVLGEAFNAGRTLGRLFKTDRKSKTFQCLDGLRALSMGWVILGHELAFEASIGYINPFAALPPTGALKGWLAQILFSSRYAVDSFFFISGFLVFHTTIKKLKESKSSVTPGWILYYVLYRWLRLTPTYMMCILLWWKIAPLLGSGPLWFHWQFFMGLCDNFWWSNLLYVNNLIPWGMGENNTCFFHGWYLANDMQFYMLTPILVMIYMRSIKAAAAVSVSMILVSTITAFLFAKSYEWSAADLDGEAVQAYDRYGYIMPWFRIPAYLIGIVLAMVWLHAGNGPRAKMDTFLASVLEMFALSLIGMCVFGGIDADQHRPCDYNMWPMGPVQCGSGPEWDTTERAIYASLTKPTWCVGLAILCFVAFLGQAGVAGWFLSHEAWIVPARLSFGMYLLHPLIINVWFQKQTQFFRWSAVDFVLRFFGVFSVTFLSAIALNLLLEGPFAHITRAIFTSRMKKRVKVLEEVAEEEIQAVHKIDAKLLDTRPAGTVTPQESSEDERLTIKQRKTYNSI